MQLLFVASDLSYGGAPRRFVDLANAMSDRGFDTTLLVYNGEVQIKDKINKSIKCVIKKTNRPQTKWVQRNVINRIKDINKINTFLRTNKYDVIISFNDMVNINLLLSKNARKSKILISERSDPHYNSKLLQLVKKLIFKKADGIVFQTKGAQAFFSKKTIDKSVIIPNPIPNNTKFERYEGEREKKIVSVARLWIYQKRQDVLLKAFKHFSAKYPDYKLILYGGGPDEGLLRDMVSELNLQSKVVLAGAVDNIPDRINKASMFILTSDFEGIPNALIEAMAMGLPVISTDCSPGGAKTLIENYVNGILIPKDNIEKLVDSMEYIVQNPENANKIGRRATKITNKLDEKSIYELWRIYICKLNKSNNKDLC